jgi:hypothetical protein
MCLLLPVLNPCIRFEWIARNWEGKYIKRAKTLIIEAVSTCYK